MTSPFRAQRAAEEFARAVDGPGGVAVAEQYGDLLTTVALLRAQPQPMPRAEFVSGLRERLLDAADEALLPRTGPRRGPYAPRRVGWRERHLGAAAVALVLVGGGAGVAAAAQGTLPGDTLYPVKRGMESVQVTINTGDAARGRELLDQASTRLDEVQALTAADASPSVLTGTLDDFTGSADEGGRLLFTAFQSDDHAEDIRTVRDFAAAAMTQLADVAPNAPSAAAAAFSRAASTLADLDQQARVLCAGCSDAAPLALPSALVGTASTASLDALVSAPTSRATVAAKLAEAAERQAREAEKVATGTPETSEALPEPVKTPVSTPTTAGAGDELGQQARQLADQPVRKLLDGLTQGKLPVVGGLGETVDSLTGTLDGTLGGTLDGTLGGTVEGLGKGVSGLTDGLGGLLAPPTTD